jgi:hypothetical protein
MAVVNSREEAVILRSLYFDYGPHSETSEEETSARDNGIVLIGFHDIFIEGEYLTVCSK